MSSNSFSKHHRLLNAGDFQAVFNDAPYRASHPNLLILARPGQGDHARLGLVIAKKHIRKAVQRNRIKRLVREYVRLHQAQLGSIDAVFLARRGLDDLENDELQRLLHKQWSRVAKKAAQAHNAEPAP